MKALIVDPDATRAAGVAEALAGSGAATTVAPSASFALTMLEWNRQDVIISRAQVGDMDAREFCAVVRSDPSTAEVRFVLIARGVTPAQMAQHQIDLVIPEGLVGHAVATRVMHLMRRVASAPRPVARPGLPPSGPTIPVPPPTVETPRRPDISWLPPVAAPVTASDPVPAPVTATADPVPEPVATDPVPAPVAATADPVPAPVAATADPVPAPVAATADPVPEPMATDPVPAPVAATADFVQAPVAATADPVPGLVAAPAAVETAPSAASDAAEWSAPAAAEPSPARTPAGAAPPPPSLSELDAVGLNGATRTFQGALGPLALEELAQALAAGGKTGRLLLVLATGGGMVAFDGGRIVHAEIGDTTGETALHSLVAASHREHGGKFCFIPSAPRDLVHVPKTITRGVADLLVGAARGTDEER